MCFNNFLAGRLPSIQADYSLNVSAATEYARRLSDELIRRKIAILEKDYENPITPAEHHRTATLLKIYKKELASRENTLGY